MSGLQVESVAAPGRVAMAAESPGPDVESVYIPGPRGLGSGGGSVGTGTFYRWRVADVNAMISLLLTLGANDVGGAIWVDSIESAVMFNEYPLSGNSIKTIMPVIASTSAGVDGGGPYIQLNYSNGTSYRAYLTDALPPVEPMERYRKIVEFRHDGGSSSEGGFATSTSGGAYGYTPAGDEPGAAYGGLTTGASATGQIAERTGTTAFNSANGPLYYLHEAAFFVVLSDETNSYIAYSGFSNTSTGVEPTNGIYFKYDKSMSVNWICVTAAGGVRTETITNIPAKILADGADRLQIKLQNGIAKFWINNALVHTETQTIPTGWAQAFGAGAAIRKTAGTTARVMAWDMLYARQELLTARDLSEPAFD